MLPGTKTNEPTGIRPKLGYNVEEFQITEVVVWLQCVFAAQLLYAVAIGLIKASLLAFYWRLFSVRSRVPLLASAAVVAAWCIATVSRLESGLLTLADLPRT